MRLIPDARKIVIEDTGHVPMMERPRTFNDVLLEFLAETGPAQEREPVDHASERRYDRAARRPANARPALRRALAPQTVTAPSRPSPRAGVLAQHPGCSSGAGGDS